ncbi:MAG: chromosome partitioning protein ParB [Rhodobacteraceae bacterium]|jgi:ParB family chromosome partitioning protein|uniref:Chromosome partitioning protein, ParB family n=1 Tax=Salipiger profundus TaxID=1229727 RepID=A0A1U7DCG2_9RHOB|nr:MULTISPECIES: ParB N-terminal domain-containing protein [Salipiger]APX25851.1 chromosome partitioning protein, ParB family [Salipiger profundus]MAB05121.1 chromosome partitioning protein ParB [Paracoccaceae bacterium]SFC80497.1 chromosome partitioning protein, ParB family [Salipiger profundus]
MSKNKFGFGPLEDPPAPARRRRDVGPMGAAVREAASSLSDSTESLVEQRRQNAADAKSWRQAQDEGRVLVEIPLDAIRTDALPRDRLDLDAVAGSDEMEELKTSIRERGQKEPIEVFEVGGGYQLKKGWRRLTALRQLHHETADPRFAHAVARVAEGAGSRIDLYIDMVEENVIREDLSFAEMAQVAITAAQEEDQNAGELVNRIYASLHKMKRSYIRSFVFLLEELGEALVFPKAVSRNLGVDVARRLQSAPDAGQGLRADLAAVASPDEQAAVLRRFLDGSERPASQKPRREKSVKYEFHVGRSKVTARKGECRILSETDFSSVDRARMQRAIEAFEAVIDEE